MEMDMLQAQVKHLHQKGCDSATIAERVDTSEKSVRVMISWYSKKGW
jgi:transposase